MQRAQLAHTEKMAAVGTLAAGVAHEVNNPLAGVLACLENMRSDPETPRCGTLSGPHPRRPEADRAHRRQPAELLAASEIHPEPTSINHNLRHVAELVGYQLRKAGVEVVFDLETRGDRGHGRPLPDGAALPQPGAQRLKAMPEGGTLTLRTSRGHGMVTAEVVTPGSAFRRRSATGSSIRSSPPARWVKAPVSGWR